VSAVLHFAVHVDTFFIAVLTTTVGRNGKLLLLLSPERNGNAKGQSGSGCSGVECHDRLGFAFRCTTMVSGFVVWMGSL